MRRIAGVGVLLLCGCVAGGEPADGIDDLACSCGGNPGCGEAVATRPLPEDLVGRTLTVRGALHFTAGRWRIDAPTMLVRDP